MQFGRNIKRQANRLAPHTCRQAVAAVVGKHHRLIGGAEGHAHEHRAKDFFRRNCRGGFHIGEQCGREKTPRRGKCDLRLEFFSPLGHTLVNQSANALELDGIYDRTHVDGLVERMAHAELPHAALQTLDEFGSNTLLHQKPRTGTAHLALVKPDGINNAFNRAIEIGIIENNERRFAAEFQSQGFASSSRCLADQAAHFGGACEGNLVDSRMFNKSRTRSPLARHHIENARRQASLVGQFRKQQSRKRGKFRRLQHHGISGSQCRGHLPCQHQQRKIPRNDLAHNAN